MIRLRHIEGPRLKAIPEGVWLSRHLAACDNLGRIRRPRGNLCQVVRVLPRSGKRWMLLFTATVFTVQNHLLPAIRYCHDLQLGQVLYNVF